jgi:hypothetical protein
MRKQKQPICCAHCGGSLGDNPTQYFKWVVCAACNTTLRTPSPTVLPPPSPRPRRRCRCSFCAQLFERDDLHLFVGDTSYLSHRQYNGRLVCEDCEYWLQRGVEYCYCCFRVFPYRVPPFTGFPDEPKHVPFIGVPVCDDCAIKLHTPCRQCGALGVHDRGLCKTCVVQPYHPARIAVTELARIANTAPVWPCTLDDVKRLWKAAARRAHPDAGGSHEAFLAVQQHYETARAAFGR